MKQSEVYGYNFPLNWDEEVLMDKVKEAIMRQIEYEIEVYEPYENDIEMLTKSDNIEAMKVWKYIEKGVSDWCDEHIQII